jgi:hypothetical protein
MFHLVVAERRHEQQSWWVLHSIGSIEQQPLVRQGVWVYVYLQTTAGAQYLRKSQGYAHLR